MIGTARPNNVVINSASRGPPSAASSVRVVDIYTRECLAIESEQRLKGEDVVTVLNRIKTQRGVQKNAVL
jgi:hypothetical protein